MHSRPPWLPFPVSRPPWPPRPPPRPESTKKRARWPKSLRSAPRAPSSGRRPTSKPPSSPSEALFPSVRLAYGFARRPAGPRLAASSTEAPPASSTPRLSFSPSFSSPSSSSTPSSISSAPAPPPSKRDDEDAKAAGGASFAAPRSLGERCKQSAAPSPCCGGGGSKAAAHPSLALPAPSPEVARRIQPRSSSSEALAAATIRWSVGRSGPLKPPQPRSRPKQSPWALPFPSPPPWPDRSFACLWARSDAAVELSCGKAACSTEGPPPTPGSEPSWLTPQLASQPWSRS
mmetsp:Transcript_30621/g.68665  ORF Transcript_30621/g.68665 Transcript_30621/m.68665 type:complete len:289 (-) Transcript_30621:270-1136(-)